MCSSILINICIHIGHLLLTRLERAMKTRALAEEALNENISGTFEGKLFCFVV